MHLIVHLTPKASQNKIEGWALDTDGQRVLCIKVTVIPEDSKANEALIKLLSQTLHLPKSKISLIRGKKSRIKQLEIDMAEEEVEFKLINF